MNAGDLQHRDPYLTQIFGVPLVQILNRLVQWKSFILRFNSRAAEQPTPVPISETAQPRSRRIQL